MAPIVFMVLIVFLSVIACDEDEALIVQALLFKRCNHLMHHEIRLVGGIAIQIPEGSRIHFIVQLVELSVFPRGLEAVEQFLGEAISV